MMAHEPIPCILADPADEIDHGLRPVDSRVTMGTGIPDADLDRLIVATIPADGDQLREAELAAATTVGWLKVWRNDLTGTANTLEWADRVIKSATALVYDIRELRR